MDVPGRISVDGLGPVSKDVLGANSVEVGWADVIILFRFIKMLPSSSVVICSTSISDFIDQIW